MSPANECRQWRVSRSVAKLSLYRSGFYIDICDSSTINTLRMHADEWAPHKYLIDDPSRIDLSVLTGNARSVTSSAAQWIRVQRLADGSEPLGIRYASRHGTDLQCWAAWVPLLGETRQEAVSSLVAAYVSVLDESDISSQDDDLKSAARVLGLRCH
jgi:hypothetical protein